MDQGSGLGWGCLTSTGHIWGGAEATLCMTCGPVQFACHPVQPHHARTLQGAWRGCTAVCASHATPFMHLMWPNAACMCGLACRQHCTFAIFEVNALILMITIMTSACPLWVT